MYASDLLNKRFVLDAADLQENARTPTWVALANAGAVAGAAPTGFYKVGPGSRWRFTGNPRAVRMLVYTDTGGGSRVGCRITSAGGTIMRDYWSSDVPTTNGFHWVEWPRLPAGGLATNTVEFFTPGQHAQGAGIAPTQAAYMVMIETDFPLVKAAALTGGVWFMAGDSIMIGANAVLDTMGGYAGRMKKRSAFGGIDKRIVVDAYGYKMLRDIANGNAMQLAYAQYIASFAPEKVIIALMTNDWLAGGWTAAQYQTGLTGLLSNIKAQPALANTPVNVVSAFITTGREGAGGTGNTMDEYRATVDPAITASGNTNAIHRIGKTMTSAANVATDGVHLLEAGHIDVQAAFQAF